MPIGDDETGAGATGRETSDGTPGLRQRFAGATNPVRPIPVTPGDDAGSAPIRGPREEGTESRELFEEPDERREDPRYPPERPLGSQGTPDGRRGGPRSNERSPIRKPDSDFLERGGGSPGEDYNPHAQRSGGRGGGLGSNRNLIGLERKIVIRVERSQVMVGSDDPIVIPVRKGAKGDQLVGQVTAAMRQVVDAWGAAPPKFYWIPAVRFEVTTAGNPVYERLRGAFERQKVKSSVDFVETSERTRAREDR